MPHETTALAFCDAVAASRCIERLVKSGLFDDEEARALRESLLITPEVIRSRYGIGATIADDDSIRFIDGSVATLIDDTVWVPVIS